MMKVNNRIMAPNLSKLVLTSHITFSAGWIGAVAVFLALAITGINSVDIQVARSAYLAMEVSAWYVIVPFCIASLATGILQSLGTKWGLFRHYWIVVKLALTVAATILLLLHMKPIGYLAGLAMESEFSAKEQFGSRLQVIFDAALAIMLLFAITMISVYKPWGKINFSAKSSYGMIRSGEKPIPYRRYLLVAGIGLILFLIVKHLFGGGALH